MAILSSELIPKERLSAYQRWELATLEETEVRPAPSQPDLDALRNEASAAGHAEGYAAGHAEGYAAGLVQSAADRIHFLALIASIGSEIKGREQELADAVLDLALALARKVVDVNISAHSESLRPVVTAALEQLPQGPRRVRVCANPADVEVVRNVLASEPGAEHWQIRPDVGITIGGCRIESDQCEIDATVETRWERVLASLGRDGDRGEPSTPPVGAEQEGNIDEPDDLTA